MPYPTFSDYKIAVGSSFNFKNAVLDPELEGGRVRLNKKGQPLFYTGGYSIVFPIDVDRLGKTFALRCWKQELKEGQERYQKIETFLKKHTLPYFVDFKYVPESVRVNGEKYPTTQMEWVEGENLCKFVEQNLGNPKIFETVADKFAMMVKDLHDQGIAHGDLQAGNILLLQKGTDIEIKLIDYDSLYVPTLGNPSDRIRGLPEYQHPQRMVGPRTLNEKVDYFSELVIYLSFRSLAEKPALWRQFVPEGKADKRLIFSADDFEDPKGSKIFQELDKMPPEVKQLALTLKTFCSERSINNLKPLEDVLPSFTFTSSLQIADNYYNQGMTYLHGKQFNYAVQQFKQAIDLNPDYKEAYYARGLAYWQMKQLQPAKKALEEALKIDPNYELASNRLADIRRESRRKTSKEKKPDIRDVHCNRAETFYNNGDLEKAKNEVEKALVIDPNYQDAQQLLKAINKEQNRSWRYFAWTLVTIATFFLIFIVFKSNTPNRTVKNRGENETVEKPPSNPIDYAKIGSAHLENKEYNEAIDAFKKAISIDPNDETVHNSLGVAYYSIQEYEDAITAFQQGLSINPELKHLHHDLGWAYYKAKKFDEAKRVVEEALKMDPNYESARELLNAILKELIPPQLSIEQISLIEPSGEGFLDADEKAHIKFTVRNSGGTASDITAHLKWDSMVGLNYTPQTISTLYENKSKTIQISIVASRTIKGKKHQKVEIQLMEKNTNLLVSRVFYITTRPLLLKPIR